MRLFDYLCCLARDAQPCPSNEAIAAVLGTHRSYVVRGLRRLDDNGQISRSGGTEYRQITILAGPQAGLQTLRPRGRLGAHTNKRRDPGPPPPCAVCGTPVTGASGKYPRTCPSPHCRHVIRQYAYGTPDDLPWPQITGPVVADFRPHNLRLLPITGRTAGPPLATSWGVPGTYDR